MARFFIGIGVPADVAEQLSKLQATTQEIVRTYPECSDLVITQGRAPLHMTLVSPFEAKARSESSVQGCIVEALKQFGSFSIVLDRLDVFEPHTIYAGISGLYFGGLRKMRHDLYYYLGQRPLEPEFTPHVSLARMFDTRRFSDIGKAFGKAFMHNAAQEVPLFSFPAVFTATHLSLYRREGDSWSVCQDFPFKKREAA